METKAYEHLKNICDKYGAQEFGKLCQQMLALTLDASGFKVMEVRLVEGVDIDAMQDGKKYAIEVKTATKNNTISFGHKDRDGLIKRKEDGYQSVVAALRLDMISDWIFAKADSIKQGSVNIDKLRAYRLGELEKLIPCFDTVVKEHYNGTMKEGQEYLNNILRQKGMKVRQH